MSPPSPCSRRLLWLPQGSSRQLMLVLTPTAIKIKLDGKTQIKDGYNHTFKIILSIHRLNTFVLQLNEVRH